MKGFKVYEVHGAGDMEDMVIYTIPRGDEESERTTRALALVREVLEEMGAEMRPVEG